MAGSTMSVENAWSSRQNLKTILSRTAFDIQLTKSRRSAGLALPPICPEPAPLLPRYDLFLREDGERHVGAGQDFCNWLQRAENSVDQTQLVALHAPEYPHMALKRPVIGWERTRYGAKISMHVPGVTKP